ncbi:ubiquitin-conjugating enzyme E2 J1-like protein [Gorgonomyces haynaldii]|nr:ubiquitin-conjugating enzyme E2 J1-like protein [Gorgonomyces haynaldii]
MEDNVFEWHFTLRGPPEGGFKGGRYHGRIMFPADYPFKPPNISFLTPNGRFEIGKKICLSITGYHPEFWRPAWGIRTAMIAIISFFLTKGEGAIGALDWPQEDRERAALESRSWKCSVCGSENSSCLPDETVVPSQKLNVDPEITISIKDNNPSTDTPPTDDKQSDVTQEMDGQPTDDKPLKDTQQTDVQPIEDLLETNPVTESVQNDSQQTTVQPTVQISQEQRYKRQQLFVIDILLIIITALVSMVFYRLLSK